MKSFKGFLYEAYSFFPKSEQDITTTLTDWPEDNVKEVIALFNHLKGKVNPPINIDLSVKTKVNVVRALKGTYTEAEIAQSVGLSKIKIKFGNGSMGNRGANNRGNLFEKDFKTALDGWYAGENNPDFPSGSMLDAIKDLDATYGLSKTKWTAKVEGEANTRRPLDFRGKIRLINTKGKGFDVGPSVTDITITKESGEQIFLSLKIEKTTTFFNVGIKTKFLKSEIDEGEIKNADAKKLLDLFGIDNKRFCTVYNPDVKTQSGIVKVRPNLSALKILLGSGIGYGYHVIHKMGGSIDSYKMDRARMKESATVTDATVYYGGKGGRGKRVDIEMSSPHYKFKLNIRDSRGKDGYPDRMMCDFTKL